MPHSKFHTKFGGIPSCIIQCFFTSHESVQFYASLDLAAILEKKKVNALEIASE